MSFKDILGHESVITRLKMALRQDRLPHALLMAGPDGVGKRRVARELAKWLNCAQPIDTEPCDACPACKKIDQDLYLDVQVIAPVDSTYVRIEQVRNLRDDAQFRPLEGRRRVFIIDEADRMNTEAANAALKTLEEPPDTTVLILITAHPQALLPTIRSRCQLLTFAPLPVDRVTAWLKAQNKYPKAADAELAARISQGSLGRALRLDLAAYKEARTAAFLAVENVFVLKSFVEVNKSALYAAKDRTGFEAFLETLLLLLRDTLVFKYLKETDLVVNSDMRDGLKRLAGHSTSDQICRFVERVTELRRGLDRNINRQLAFESMLLDLTHAG